MAICKNDIKQGVLDKVLDELDNRYTYSRVSADTIMINSLRDNSKSKVSTKGDARFQAKQIANSVLKSIYNSYNGYVTGYVNDIDRYTPITVTFRVDDRYINHLYNNVPSEQKELNMSPISEEEQERDFVNTDSDWNSINDLDDAPFEQQEPVKGVFRKFIEHKERILNGYKTRLNRIEAAKNLKGVTKEQLDNFNKLEREIKLAIDGNFELKKEGLEQEIARLKEGVIRNSIGYYAERDILRLDKLSKSNSVEDIKEAESIMDFYKAAGTFTRGMENPFFAQEEIFLKDGNTDELSTQYRINDEDRKMFEDIKDQALGYESQLIKRKEELLVETVNSDYSVINTYGDKQFTVEELLHQKEGLKDANWADMWFNDVTVGTFSHNGLIPQVIYSVISNRTEIKKQWSRDIAERIENMMEELHNELKKPELKQRLKDLGIDGLHGITYNMFQEKTKEGLDTHTLVSRYERSFNDDSSIKLGEFYDDFNSARLEKNPEEASRKFAKAFNKLKSWKLNNTMIMDVSKLPEIANDENFSEFNAVVNEEYKNYLVSILGEKGYKQELEKQKNLLTKYQSQRESFKQTILIEENKNEDEELSEQGKASMEYWEMNHNPLKGIEDYNSVTGLEYANKRFNNHMDYNNLIPRKYKVVVKGDLISNKYTITDTKELTGHYSKVFEIIENNPTLSKFYDIAKEACDKIRESLPADLQDKMPVNTLPGLKKVTAEILADKNLGILKSIIPSIKHLLEKFRLSGGINKQSELSYAKLEVGQDGTKTNYSVNSSFLKNNNTAIQQRRFIETTKFLQSWNGNKPKNNKISLLTKNTILQFKDFNVSSLIDLANYTNTDISVEDIRKGNVQKLKDKVGEKVEIGRIIKDFSIHSVVQSQSYDLPKLIKYFSDMAMVYSAKEEARPLLEILKKHYDSIKKPHTTNIGNSILNVHENTIQKAGYRENAKKQFEDWFNRVALDNFGQEHFGASDKNIYSDEEKAKIKEIDELIKNETNENKIKELQKIKDSLGKVPTLSAKVNSLLNYIRFWRLGFNLSSSVTNFMEGVTSNMILGADNEYFDPKELFYGYRLVKYSMLKNASFGVIETSRAKKLRKLMDKYDVLIDSRNELQKSSRKTNSDKFKIANPYGINSKVEYINQSPIMTAMLRTIKIKGKDGVESSVWDAFDKEGKLTDNFRTEENVHNWEELKGEDYLNFKQKLHTVIGLGHGFGYNEMRGTMAKTTSLGKAGMMFKTFLPTSLFWRFAEEQDNIQLGVKNFKGIYRSETKGVGIVHGALAGTLFFGPLGTVIGGVAGAIAAKGNRVDTGMGMLKESILAAKQLFLSSLGIPINFISGRHLINNTKAFESWIGKGNFTERDARNLRATMADISMQLVWLAMMIAVKTLFWDDKDKPDAGERIAHNILMNKLMSLSSQASSYTSLPALYKSTVGSIGLISFLNDATKEVERTAKWFEGKDIIGSGPNRGLSGLGIQTKKMLIPGIFKDQFLGFGNDAAKQFNPSPFDNFFESPEKRDKELNKSLRAQRKIELLKSDEVKKITDDKERDKYIKEVLDDELPTPARLNKLGETRKEYEKDRDSTSN